MHKIPKGIMRDMHYINLLLVNSNQIIFIGLRSSKDYYKRPGGGGGVYIKGNMGLIFLRGSMCADGMGCKRRWVRWELRETGTASCIQD